MRMEAGHGTRSTDGPGGHVVVASGSSRGGASGSVSVFSNTAGGSTGGGVLFLQAGDATGVDADGGQRQRRWQRHVHRRRAQQGGEQRCSLPPLRRVWWARLWQRGACQPCLRVEQGQWKCRGGNGYSCCRDVGRYHSAGSCRGCWCWRLAVVPVARRGTWRCRAARRAATRSALCRCRRARLRGPRAATWSCRSAARTLAWATARRCTRARRRPRPGRAGL